MIRLIGVVGGDPCSPEEAAFARALGEAIARLGHGIVTGGLGGVMEAASQGAKENGGTTVGLLPGSDPATANPFVDIVIPTGMGELRNGLVIRSAEVVVAVGGEYGTLSEIALALKAGKPVFGWRTWSFSRDPMPSPAIIAVTSVEEAAMRVSDALSRRDFS